MIGFEELEYTVSEREGIVTVAVVVLNNEPSRDVVVRLETRDGTATRACKNTITSLPPSFPPSLPPSLSLCFILSLSLSLIVLCTIYKIV